MHGLFVTGTDTGVGKTVVTAAIVAALRAGGRDAIGLKPVVTGTDEPAESGWPPDHELLAAVSDAAVNEVNFAAYGPPVSPHLAAELSGRRIDPTELTTAIRNEARRHALTIVEGVGGLLVPITDGYDVRDLAAELRLPLIVVARSGLGTINHTLLTMEAARAHGLEVAAVVLNRFPRAPVAIERSNRETIKRLLGGGGVEVITFPELASADRDALAAAGRALPLARWSGTRA
ncbi:MAG TPA: dethiobiotin synthase [Solirubrobacteraceae bacterium]|nr:dethiobiotin synthase [Solirubrobacteraceae bacterium]